MIHSAFNMERKKLVALLEGIKPVKLTRECNMFDVGYETAKAEITAKLLEAMRLPENTDLQKLAQDIRRG